jgi:hypothetical protein
MKFGYESDFDGKALKERPKETCLFSRHLFFALSSPHEISCETAGKVPGQQAYCDILGLYLTYL